MKGMKNINLKYTLLEYDKLTEGKRIGESLEAYFYRLAVKEAKL